MLNSPAFCHGSLPTEYVSTGLQLYVQYQYRLQFLNHLQGKSYGDVQSEWLMHNASKLLRNIEKRIVDKLARVTFGEHIHYEVLILSLISIIMFTSVATI